MTQKDKELSFIDISGRLHYGVIVNYKQDEYDRHKWKITNLHTLSYSQSGSLIDTDYDGWISYEEHEGCGMSSGSRPFRFGEVLPYLRPMSSMTEAEKNEFIHYAGYEVEESVNGRHYEYYLKDYVGTPEKPSCNCDAIDWLNKHHFDFRNLIERKLAIAVTEENNPYK